MFYDCIVYETLFEDLMKRGAHFIKVLNISILCVDVFFDEVIIIDGSSSPNEHRFGEWSDLTLVSHFLHFLLLLT